MLDKSDITSVRRQKKLKLRQRCHHICPRPKGRKFLTTKKSVLATKSKNVGASWPRGFFLKSSPVRFKEKPREHLSVDTWCLLQCVDYARNSLFLFGWLRSHSFQQIFPGVDSMATPKGAIK